MLQSLQSLRFIFACLIFCFHFPIGTYEPLFPEGGAIGVSFFLVLSGFVMSLGYADKVSQNNFRWYDFIFKRLIKLWPLHILCLFIWIGAAYMAWGGKDIHLLPLMGNAILLQSWFPIKEMEGNSVAWYLSTLVSFYMIYPILAKLSLKKLIVFFCTLTLFISLFSNFIPAQLQEWYWYKFPPTRLIDFVLGIILYHTYVRLNRVKLPPIIFRDLLPLTFFAIGLFIIHGKPNMMEISGRVFYLVSGITILSYAIYERRGYSPMWLKNRTLLYLGEISFSFYMIHNLVILITKQILSRVYPDHHWTIRFIVTFLVAIIGSIIVNKYFEQPISKLLSRSTRR